MGSSVTYTTNARSSCKFFINSSFEPNFCDQWFGHTAISSSDANMSILLGSEFTSSLGIKTPNLSSDAFQLPANTGANMTIAISASSLDQYAGGQIGAFYDLNGDGNYNVWDLIKFQLVLLVLHSGEMILLLQN